MKYVYMDQLSFREQVQLFYNSDIIFSPHGSALLNLLFCVPHSAAIECNPPYFYELWYINTASLSLVHYISVSTFYTNHQANKLWEIAENSYYDGNFSSIRREYVNFNIDPPLFEVLCAVSDAIEYVNRWRLNYEVNDKWSPIFY